MNQARSEQAEVDALDPSKAALDLRLAAVIGGAPFGDKDKRFNLADRASEKNLNASAALFYAEALRIDGGSVADPLADITYQSLCSAALAGCGQGFDAPPQAADAQARFQRQALDGLWSGLQALSRLGDTHRPEQDSERIKTVDRWRQDPDLLGIRDEPWLEKFPEAERVELRRFWAEVEQLRSRFETTL